MKIYQLLVKFLTHHHKLELIFLIISSLILLSSVTIGLVIYIGSQKSSQLISQGDESLQAEDFDAAVANYSEAQKVITNPIFKSAQSDPKQRLKLALKLATSHEHFVTGVGLYNNKNFAAAVPELKKVDSLDNSYPLVLKLVKDSKSAELEEQKNLEVFSDLRKKSLSAFANKKWDDFIAIANQALALGAEDPLVNKDQINDLTTKKTQARDAQSKEKALEEARRNLFQVRVPILMYHYIRVNADASDRVGYSLSVTPSDFDEQMKYLASNGYHATDVNSVEAAIKNKTPLSQKTIVLTFDDGYADFYLTAFPILKQYNLHSESYLVSSFVGQPFYLNWDMIKEMQGTGLVTFGSHTVSHAYLTALNQDSAAREIGDSKKTLEEHLGTVVTDFCYPYGAFNNNTASLVKKAGYLNATTTVGGLWHADGEDFILTRVRVGGGESLATFKGTL